VEQLNNLMQIMMRRFSHLNNPLLQQNQRQFGNMVYHLKEVLSCLESMQTPPPEPPLPFSPSQFFLLE